MFSICFRLVNPLRLSRSLVSSIPFNKPSFNSIRSLTDKMVFNYPKPRRDESIKEDLHGVTISDPYRWLEEPDAEETANFVHEQNKITRSFIDKCDVKDKISEKLKLLIDYPRYGCPFRRGSRYFYNFNNGLQNQSVLYVQDSLDSEARIYMDPNEWCKDGLISLNFTDFSEDNEWMAYGISDSGSDWRRIKIRHVETEKDNDEILYFIKYSSPSWTHDSKGFFYSRYPKPEKSVDGTENTKCLDQKVYYHRIGTKQEEDVLIWEVPEEPEWTFNPLVSDCGKYLFMFVHESCKNEALYYCPLEGEINGKLELIPIIDKFENEYEFIANDGPIVYWKTNRNANNYKVIKMDLNNMDEKNWVDIIPEHEKNVLETVRCVDGDKLVTIYIEDVTNTVQFRSLHDGKVLLKPNLPIGSIVGLSGKRTQSQIFLLLSNLLSPGVIYKYDFNGDSDVTVFRETPVKGFDPAKFTMKQIFYPSKDGTKIPMFIVHANDMALNGENPCQLYGYGGFNISLFPTYSPSRLVWIENFKGILAIANIRGGGEYGEKWHDGGRLDTKQNCFDDFISGAEYLINNKYTQTKKLYIEGGSNGGLLVAACSNQRPELFGATICHVGVLDCLRFHKFGIGKFWTSDYGNPDKLEDFRHLIKYSPLHNIPIGTNVYPSMLLLSADHDDRVSPFHTLKFVAQLQHSLNHIETPILARIETNAGHGAFKPISKRIEEQTDIYSFVKLALDLPFYE